MSEATITSEVGPPKEVKQYDTEYGFEIKDPDELYEVARLLVSEPDFVNGEVSIGRTDNDYVSNWPRLVVHEEGLFFNLNCRIHDYTWERMTASGAKRARINKLIGEHVNPGYSFTSWKNREVKNSKGELVAEFDNHSVFSYQFSDDDLSQGEFLVELREALVLQQIIMSEAEREMPSVTRFSSGLVVGNPYIYSKGQISLPYNPTGSHIAVEDKFRRLTEEYLVTRMPDLEEARKVLTETVPKLTQAELEIRRLKEEVRGSRVGKQRRLRSGTGADILQEVRVAAEFDENCEVLGVNPGIFKEMTNEEARKYVDGLRKTWARMYHSKGGYSDEMREKNNAADRLVDHLSGEQSASK